MLLLLIVDSWCVVGVADLNGGNRVLQRVRRWDRGVAFHVVGEICILWHLVRTQLDMCAVWKNRERVCVENPKGHGNFACMDALDGASSTAVRYSVSRASRQAATRTMRACCTQTASNARLG